MLSAFTISFRTHIFFQNTQCFLSSLNDIWTNSGDVATSMREIGQPHISPSYLAYVLTPCSSSIKRKPSSVKRQFSKYMRLIVTR